MDILDLRMIRRETSYRSNISSYPLTPPREDQLGHRSEEQLSHRSDSPRTTSVIQSVGALRGASSVFMSPHSQLSCSSPLPSKLVSPDHPLTPPLQDTESTYCNLMNNSPVLQKSDDLQMFGKRHFYEPSYETPACHASPPRNVSYEPTLPPTSDIPRPFKNYAKKYIATLRESDEYLKFKHDMMNRIKSVNSTKSSWLEEGVRSPGSSHDDEEAGEEKSAGQQRPRSPGYWQRRKKNNVAAKKSRDLRRQREDELAIFAAFLDQENEKLRSGNILMLQHCKHLETCLETSRPPFVPLEFQNNCHRYGYGKAPSYVVNGGFMETHNFTMS